MGVPVGAGLAGRILGRAAPTWQRVEAICQEYLGAHPAPVREKRGDGDEADVPADGSKATIELKAEVASRFKPAPDKDLKAWLEEKYDRWSFLYRVLGERELAGGRASEAPFTPARGRRRLRSSSPP